MTRRALCRGPWVAAASHVFLLEPNLNPAVEAQAIGRAYRMGQTAAVQVHRLVVRGTVEERIQAGGVARTSTPPTDVELTTSSFAHLHEQALDRC